MSNWTEKLTELKERIEKAKDALGHGSDARGIMGMSNKEFKDYATQRNAEYQQRMLSAGYEYWPAIDRWYPKGTKIEGLQPGPPKSPAV